MTKPAILYRMALDTHICPWGLKARHILRANGYQVDDRLLTTREEVDRLHRAGFARVYLPQDCLLQQVRPAHQGPYRVREFLQTGQPLN